VGNQIGGIMTFEHGPRDPLRRGALVLFMAPSVHLFVEVVTRRVYAIALRLHPLSNLYPRRRWIFLSM
jgi:hypothetical protein